MFGVILLQAGIAAGLFILTGSVLIFIIGSIGAWIFFGQNLQKKQIDGNRGKPGFFRFLKSIGVAIILILLFLLLLMVWNPVII